MSRAALVAVLGLLATTPVAIAAPPWSAPESVSSPSLFVDSPHVVFDSAGRAYATWLASGDVRLAVREPGVPEFGPERSAPDLLTPLLAHGSNRVLGLDQRPGGRPDVISLRARFSRPDGSFGRPDTISTYGVAGGLPSLAVHDVALAAWSQGGPNGRRIVRAAIRRPGHRFGRPITLRARGRARDVVAGAGPGVLIVAWERAGVVEARVRFAGRGGWGPVQRLGPAAKGSTTFRVALAGERAYLAWLSGAAESAVLRAAVLPVGGTRFRATQVIDTIDRPPPGDDGSPALVPLTGRGALLAWTDWDGARWRVRGAASEAFLLFGPVLDVSPANEQAVLGNAASIPPGAPTVLVVWSRLDALGEVGDRVRAAMRPPGGSFGPPEDVSDSDRARLPHVAFDFVSGRWTAVWSQRIGPDQGVPPSQITTFLRSSTRPG